MKNTYYVVVGILVLVIGYLFYKKLQEQKANAANPENGSSTTPTTSVEGVTPVNLPTATPVYNPFNLKNGDSVTVLSGKNLRKTDPPYSVVRKTTAQEKGWKVHGRVYVNTIDKITGSWCVIKKEIFTFGSVPFLSTASYANTTVYQVVAVTSLIKA